VLLRPCSHAESWAHNFSFPLILSVVPWTWNKILILLGVLPWHREFRSLRLIGLLVLPWCWVLIIRLKRRSCACPNDRLRIPPESCLGCFWFISRWAWHLDFLLVWMVPFLSRKRNVFGSRGHSLRVYSWSWGLLFVSSILNWSRWRYRVPLL